MKYINKILIVVVIFVTIYFGIYTNQNEPTKIKIGIIGHFSGEYASYSVPMKKGMELALNKLDPENIKYELIIEDDGADASKAASAINKLLNIDKVDYILSAQGSGATSVIVPIVEDARKILMITLASAPDLLKGTEYIFRSVPSDSYQGVEMIYYINEILGSQKVAGLYANDPYGIGIKNIIESKNRGKNVISELFIPGTTDFRTNLLKIKESNPDTIILVARENEYSLILRQINELGIKANIVASETFKDEKILVNSGQNAEDVVTFVARPKDHVGFAQEYKRLYSEEPSAYSMYGYDGMLALINVISDFEDDTEKVKNALYEFNQNGASGVVSFDSSGDRSGVEYIIYKVVDSKFVRQ